MNDGLSPRLYLRLVTGSCACAALIIVAAMLASPVMDGARAAPARPHLIAAAGDIATAHGAQASTAQLIRRHLPRAHVLTLGDNAYPDNSPANYAKYYAPTWGRFKSITLPSPGNHEYRTPKASGYFGYFHRPAYYAHAEGSWLLLSLDSVCGKVGGCTRASPQGKWLAAKLAHTTRRCILAFFHHPLFNAGRHGPTPAVRPLWAQLYGAHADVILNGHDHNYQRYNRLSPDGQATNRGIREFVVGTGGAGLYTLRARRQTRPRIQSPRPRRALHGTRPTRVRMALHQHEQPGTRSRQDPVSLRASGATATRRPSRLTADLRVLTDHDPRSPRCAPRSAAMSMDSDRRCDDGECLAGAFREFGAGHQAV